MLSFDKRLRWKNALFLILLPLALGVPQYTEYRTKFKFSFPNESQNHVFQSSSKSSNSYSLRWKILVTNQGAQWYLEQKSGFWSTVPAAFSKSPWYHWIFLDHSIVLHQFQEPAQSISWLHSSALYPLYIQHHCSETHKQIEQHIYITIIFHYVNTKHHCWEVYSNTMTPHNSKREHES